MPKILALKKLRENCEFSASKSYMERSCLNESNPKDLGQWLDTSMKERSH